jgi:hypothetical protein
MLLQLVPSILQTSFLNRIRFLRKKMHHLGGEPRDISRHGIFRADNQLDPTYGQKFIDEAIAFNSLVQPTYDEAQDITNVDGN